MTRKFAKAVLFAAAALGVFAAAPAGAQTGPQAPWTNTDPAIKTTFVRLAPGVPGLLFEPSQPGPKSAVAIFAMHSAADYLNHSVCSNLARRGYRVLCANNTMAKSGGSEDGNLDRTLLEAKAAVGWLRTVPGVKKVVLFGHSGGATVMSAYQMIAEGGTAACQRPELIWKCGKELEGLPRADGIVFADANWGVSTMTLFSIDPAITNEDSGRKLNPALDMYNPANGFVATGSRYSPEFVKRFLGGEGVRANAITQRAQARLAAIKAGKGRFVDDEPFYVPGASLYGYNNKLFSQDTRLLSRSLKAWPLVHKDGSVTNQIIRSVRPATNAESRTPYINVVVRSTVKGYLNSYATRTGADFSYGETSEIKGVDWRSNYANAPGNVQSITMPLLALGLTGGWEGLAAETIYNFSASTDRHLAFIEGATHIFTTCTRCETTPGQYGDTVKTTYDYIDLWLSKPGRFL